MSADNQQPAYPELDSIRGAFLVLGGLLVILGQFLSNGLALGGRWGMYLVTGTGMFMFYLSVRAYVTNQFSPFLYTRLINFSRWLGIRPYQVLLLIAAPFVSLVAWFAAGDAGRMIQPILAVFAWLLSIAMFLVAHWRTTSTSSRIDWTREDTVLFFMLFAISIVLRVLLIDEIPWLLTGDEGSAGLSAVQFIDRQRNNIFDVGWYSFPSLFFWIQSLSVRLLGQTSVALRLPSVIAGALTVALLYWSTKPFLGRKMALGASSFLAAFHFHVHFSRIGLNNVWDGLFTVLFIGLFWRAWSGANAPLSKTSIYYALAGLTLGLSQYFYTSLRMLVVVFLFFLIWRAIRDRRFLQTQGPGLFSTSLGFVVIVLPLAAFFIKYPDQFAAPMERVSSLGTWLQEEIALSGKSALQVLANQFKTAALGFTSVNLNSWYEPDHPMLLAIPAALFILALIILLFRLKQPLFQWILLWMLGGMVISALSESTPAAQRLTFVAPVVALLVALPLASIYEWLAPMFPDRGTWVLAVLTVILGAAIFGDVAFYFGDYSLNRQFGDLNTEVAQGVAGYVNTIGDSPTVYFCGLPRMGYYSHASTRYLAPDVYGEDVPEPIQEPPSNPITGTAIYIFLPERVEEIEYVKAAYPDGEEFEFIGRAGDPIFTAYAIRE